MKEQFIVIVQLKLKNIKKVFYKPWSLWMRAEIKSWQDQQDIAGQISQNNKPAVLLEGITLKIGHYEDFNDE